MIEPLNLSLHQDLAFLIKSDMAEHQIMQSVARHIAREFASADMIAASLTAGATSTLQAERNVAAEFNVTTIESLIGFHQLNYPLALRRGLEQLGFLRAPVNTYDEQHEQDNHKSEPDPAAADTAISEDDLAIFRAVDHLLPSLQDEGLCTGLQLGLYRTSSNINSLWRDRVVAIVLFIGGQLGNRGAVFTYLLRSGFKPVAIQGRIALQAGSLIHPMPCQQIAHSSMAELASQSCLVVEKTETLGKSFLLGMIPEMPPRQHWLDLDHRDMD